VCKFHWGLNKKIAVFHLKHREEHFVSKIAMESIMKGVHVICLSLHSLFADVFANHVSSNSESSTALNLLLDSENSFLNSIFSSLTRSDQLKSYCKKNLDLICP